MADCQGAGPVAQAPLTWRVAQRCNSGACVRVASSGDDVFIGDSKSPDGPVLSYSRAEWQAFVEGIRHGEFDDLP